MNLWPHQQTMADFAVATRHSILFAGMGSGKSGAAIAAMNMLDNPLTVIVCPPRVINTWADQLALWGYDGPVTLLNQRSTASRMKALAGVDAEGVVVTNYQGFWRDGLYDVMRSLGAKMVVYDEVHNLKAAGSKQSRRAYSWHMGFDYRLGLTGTLVSNGRQDIYGQARAINPSVFGTSYNRFASKYLVMGGYEMREIAGYKNVPEYDARLAQFVKTIDTSEMLDLPPYTVTDWKVDLEPSTLKNARKLAKEMIVETDAGVVTASNVLVKATRLRMMSNGIVTNDAGDALMVDNSKTQAVLDWLDSVGPYPTIVWMNFIVEGDNLYRAATAAGYRVSRVYGGHDEYAAWVGGDTDVLVMSLQAGAEGLNDMVRARHVLYASPTYSLMRYDQSFKRTHRPGADLNQTVHYTRLVSNMPIEKAMYKALSDKSNMADAVFRALMEVQNV